MEHVNDVTAQFYPCRVKGGPVTVMEAGSCRVLATIPMDLPDSEQWRLGTKMARGLCYDLAGLQRAHRAGRMGFVAGLLAGILAMLTLNAALGLRLPSQCVNVGPYATVPNG